MREYAVIIERGENSYGAYVPDLPGCVAIAESETEVRKLIREAIELHVKATLDERGRNQGQPACFRTGAAGLTENSSTTTRPTASARPAKAHARQTIREGKQGENRDSLNCVLRSIDFLAPRIAALSGAGIISPEDALDFHMTAKLQSFGGMQLVTGRSVPFFIKGTAASPSFEPDMKGMATGDFKALGGLFGKRKR